MVSLLSNGHTFLAKLTDHLGCLILVVPGCDEPRVQCLDRRLESLNFLDRRFIGVIPTPEHTRDYLGVGRGCPEQLPNLCRFIMRPSEWTLGGSPKRFAHILGRPRGHPLPQCFRRQSGKRLPPTSQLGTIERRLDCQGYLVSQ